MNAKEQYAVNQIEDRIVTEIGLKTNATIHGAVRKVVTGKTQAERIYALNYLLDVISRDKI